MSAYANSSPVNGIDLEIRLEDTTDNTNNNRQSSKGAKPTQGLKDFIAQTANIGNIITSVSTQKTEPLPFIDYSQFQDTYGKHLPKRPFAQTFENRIHL